jgi:hypothetical protein
MRVHPRDDAAWSFETANFFIGFYAEPEEMSPAETFQFAEDIEAVRSGRVEWFAAIVRVYAKLGSDDPRDWREIGADYLGGCAYNSVREFFTSHRDPDPANRNTLATKARGVCICHYFPGMVTAAVEEARKASALSPI